MTGRRKESVVSDVVRTLDELPSVVAKLTTTDTLYPFSQVLRLRVLQVVCGISVVVMGAVACINDRSALTKLGLGVPAGVVTVIAAGSSAESEEVDDTDKDEDFNPEENNDTESSASEQPINESQSSDQVVEAAFHEPGKGKGRKRKKQGRKSFINKMLRNAGKEHVGHRGKNIKAKVMEQLAGKHNCRYKCIKNINDQERQEIFSEFWSLANWNLQTAFVCSCVALKLPTKKNKNATNPKQTTKIVTLKGFRVCKEFFIKTLGISHNRFDLVTDKMSETGFAPTAKRGKGEKKNKIDELLLTKVKEHISLFPKYRSHYSRRHNPNKQYLSSDLSISLMYKLYCDWCTENGYENVKEWCYRNVFNTCFNLSFHRPHTDTCNKCDTFAIKLKNETDETILSKTKLEQEIHHRKAQLAVEQKQNDKKYALSREDVALFTFDLQKTLPTPSLTSNKVYYLRVLWTYNLGIHDLKTGDASMYMWSEHVASRGSQEIGSCLKKYSEDLNGVKHVIAYSDCCGGQNRNKNILKYWMYIIRESELEVVDHKFLEPGHTYMECDQDFGRIEKEKKRYNCVYVTQDWIDIVKKTSKKFTVNEMKKDNFFSISAMNDVTKSFVNKDDEGNKILWRNIRWIRVENKKPLTMLFKESLNEDLPFRSVDYSKRNIGRPRTVTLPQLHPEGVKIKHAKYKNLQELKSLIPPVHHTFFHNLPHDEPQRPHVHQSIQQRLQPEVDSETSELSSDSE